MVYNDYAGRLANEYSSSKLTAYSYDVRGNLLEAMDFNPSSRIVNTYVGDRLMSMTQTSSGSAATSEFTYDNLGRMISDGQVGQSIMYNDLDLIGKITKNGTTLVNYSYLVDGTKLSALKDSGEGLVYRGPFVYRKSAGPGIFYVRSDLYGKVSLHTHPSYVDGNSKPSEDDLEFKEY